MSSDGVFEVGAILVGKYRIEKLLGQGGMGAVYLAENTDIGRRVAIKVLRPEMAGQPEALTRFKQEARNAASIGHPGIVEILDLGSLPDGGAYIVMEALDGETLRERLQRLGTMTPRDAASILAQVLDTLAAAHDKGVIHRDLKPENLFLVERPTPGTRILDFGISKLTGTSDVALTRTGMVMGTPLYMSPEQAAGARNLGPLTDVYSMGAILYEALSGQPPFPGESYNEVLAQVLTQHQRPVNALRPDVPKPLSDLIEAMLSKEPAQRPKDARAASLQLRQLMSLPSPDTTVNAAPLLLTRPTDSGPVGVPKPPPRALIVSIAGVMSLVVVLGFGWKVKHDREVEARPPIEDRKPIPSVIHTPAGPTPDPLPPTKTASLCDQQPCTVYAATQHRLYAIDPAHPGAPALVCDFGGALTPTSEVNDIAVSPTGALYGITADALFAIDPHSCAGTRIAGVKQAAPFNALSWDPSGKLVAADPSGALFDIDPATGEVTPSGNIGPGLISSGDLVSTGTSIYVAAHEMPILLGSPDVLVELGADHHFVRKIGPLPGADTYALAFWGGKLFALDKAGHAYLVDPATGAGKLLGTVPEASFYGAASTPAAPSH